MSDDQNSRAKYWAVVPAAGIGARMGGETPKQYLPLLGKPIIAHTLTRLCDHPRISGVAVAIAAGDTWWPHVQAACSHAPIVVTGGEQRRDSVLCGLDALIEHGAADDWVLVHDAVRPCLRDEDIDALIAALAHDPVGGLLAMPVKDTMKRGSGDERVCETVSRERLWHAQTPQMFRLGALREALRLSVEEDRDVTDEAQAMELTGARPRLVRGSDENLKITRPEDLRLAEMYMKRRSERT